MGRLARGGVGGLLRLSVQLALGSDRVIGEFEPHIELCTDSAEPAWGSLSPSLKINKLKKKRKKKKKDSLSLWPQMSQQLKIACCHWGGTPAFQPCLSTLPFILLP